MSTGIISIGITGLQAAQLGLLTSEHNITNANTPGYSRQRIQQGTNVPILTGAGAIGQGTHVSTIERMYSQFLTNQVNASQTSVSELDTYYAEIKQIDNMLADPNSGLSPALQDFFRGVQQVAANPSSMPARQAMISSAETMVARFHSIEDRLSQMAEGVNSQITSTVATVNSYAQQIASLNERIIVAESSIGQPANDLLDQRDQLINELNKLIKVSTTTNTDGSFNVFIGTGQQLVVGTQAMTMTANASAADPSRIVVGLQNAGSSQELPEFLVTGGKLGGLVRFRSESLDRAFNEMGRVAASLALTFNAQHGLGQDLLGQSIGSAGFMADFFNVQNMQPGVIKNANNQGAGILQANLIYRYPASLGAYDLSYDGATYSLTSRHDGTVWTGNTLATLQDANGNPFPAGAGVDLSAANLAPGGSSVIYAAAGATQNSYTDVTVSDYRLSYSNDGINPPSYTMIRLSDGKKWTDASLANLSSTISLTEGFSLSLSGAMADRDSFLIQPTRNAARNITVNANISADPRLIAAGFPFRTGAVVTNTGTGSISAGQSLYGYTSTSLPPGGVTLTYDSATKTFSGFPAGTNVSVTLSDGTTDVYAGATAIPFISGARYSFNGIGFEMTGQPDDGDRFTISSNTGNIGVSDGRNSLLLAKLQTQNTIAGGTASYQAAYAQFVSNTGNKTRETQVTGEAQQALLEQAQGAREALSGVNLDEEAGNLLRYQQAYQAAAKIIDIGNKLFDTILSIRS